ncbi:hypothetical protein SAMN05216480_10527 [Pustulibacterium marinum]|uniref:Lipoprotein n=1 Tax=Pustulibacterium marinum TaxID=1224947 RepID=A0A1I7GKX1_9FLAO|nr:hypothetical protein [Pustulibacterium marinum]SFU48906.1 hypothetical protein SAMN05216480_10527 [Pustulibacterium marinum]
MKKLLVLLLIFISCSCGSVSKSKEKSEFENQKESAVDLSEVSKETSEILAKNSMHSHAVENAQFLEVEVSPGESLSITQRDENGKETNTTFSGSGKIKFGSSEKEEINTEENHTHEAKQTEKVVDSTATASSTEKGKTITANVERSGGFPWWLLLLVLIALVAAAIYLNKQFSWILKLKNGVTSVYKAIFKI